MQCCVNGCEKPAKFKADKICQMHYFRRMRYGTFELTRKAGRKRFLRDDGYVMVHAPDHHLARRGYAAEHRIVAFQKYGDHFPDCELCGIPLDWETAVIDHIDEVKTNNDPSNLRPLCNYCNLHRTKRPGTSYHRAVAVTFNGQTMTPTEWARQPGVNVHGATIRRRLANGASAEEAIYGRKITHNGNVNVPPPPPPKHTRRNSVALQIDGELKTAGEWARDKRCHVSDATLRNRARAGWLHTAAILLPLKAK